MKLMILACIAVMFVSFGVDSAAAQYRQFGNSARNVRPVVRPVVRVARPSAPRQFQRQQFQRQPFQRQQFQRQQAVRPPPQFQQQQQQRQQQQQARQQQDRARIEARRLEQAARRSAGRTPPRQAPAPQQTPIATPGASGGAPPPRVATTPRRIGKRTTDGPTAAPGVRPIATTVALTGAQCAGANAATEWCRARQKFVDDRSKHAADMAAWRTKKAEVDKQNAEIDRKNAADAKKVADRRKKADEANLKQAKKEDRECARATSRGQECRGSTSPPLSRADVPARRHNVVPPPPAAPAAPAILSSAPPGGASGTQASGPQSSGAGGPAGTQSAGRLPGSATPLPLPLPLPAPTPFAGGTGGNRTGDVAMNSAGGGSRTPPTSGQPAFGTASGNQAIPSDRTIQTGLGRPAATTSGIAAAGSAAGGAAVAASAAASSAAASSAAASSIARSTSSASGASWWRHNNSQMQVMAEPQAPNSLRIVYDKPRSGLAPLGIKSGTMLFSGVRDGNTVTGAAVTFSKRCGPTEFPVSGQIVNETRVVLQGQKPNRNDSCETIGSGAETLEFDLIRR